jgi:hypothetical protein
MTGALIRRLGFDPPLQVCRKAEQILTSALSNVCSSFKCRQLTSYYLTTQRHHPSSSSPITIPSNILTVKPSTIELPPQETPSIAVCEGLRRLAMAVQFSSHFVKSIGRPATQAYVDWLSHTADDCARDTGSTKREIIHARIACEKCWWSADCAGTTVMQCTWTKWQRSQQISAYRCIEQDTSIAEALRFLQWTSRPDNLPCSSPRPLPSMTPQHDHPKQLPGRVCFSNIAEPCQSDLSMERDRLPKRKRSGRV